MTEVKSKRKPTIKQLKTLDNLVANGGNITKAMLDAGYSRATANTPQKFTESQAIQEYLEKYLPDKKLLLKHQELLNKQEVIVRNNVSTGEIEVIPTGQIDVTAVSKALDMAYKLKGTYAPEKSIVANIQVSEVKRNKSNGLFDSILGN